MKHEYANWSTRIFDGFYESNLYDSDAEYYLNEILQDEEHPEELEVDFNNYCENVAKLAVSLLEDYCIIYKHDNIIKSMKFIRLNSPSYYNFTTDKLVIDIDFNLAKLKTLIAKRKDDFNQYLEDNFTSYDGFISFVANNYNDFMEDYKTSYKKDRCINVMLEYYILTCIYERNWSEIEDNYSDTGYHYKLYEQSHEILINSAVEVETV